MVRWLVAILLPLGLLYGCSGDDGAEEDAPITADDAGDADLDAGMPSVWTDAEPVAADAGPDVRVPPTDSGTVGSEKSTSCVAQITDGSTVLRAETTLFYTVSGTKVTLKRFEMLVKNGFGGDKSDAAFMSVTGTKAEKMFGSGDILENNKKITISAGNRVLATSQKVRVETHFDKSLAFDPSAKCDMSIN